MRLKQVNSSNNASSPDENSSNYSFNGRENSNANSTFDIQQFKKLLEQRITELKLNPANTTQSTIKYPKESSNRFQSAEFNQQLIQEFLRNGGDFNSMNNLMNSLANNTCASPSSSNQEEYSYQDDDLEDEEQDVNENHNSNVFPSSLDLSIANGALKQQLSRHNIQRLQRRNNSEDECNYSDNDDEEMRTGDLDENSNDFDNSIVQDKRSKLLNRPDSNTGTSKKRKSAQPQYINPKDNLEDNEKQLNDKKLIDQDEESSMHSIEAQ